MQAVSIRVIMVVALFFLAAVNGQGGQIDPVEQTIRHLISSVAGSELTFVRNATQYTGQQASEHMQNKYGHFRSEIKTPEDFIELCATRSLLTGKPYLIINEQGERISTRDWLLAVLQAYRNSSASESP